MDVCCLLNITTHFGGNRGKMVKTINGYQLDELQVVPEQIVKYCAGQFSHGEENTFKDFLEVAEEFRDAGLTPVFLTTDRLKDLFVTTEEMIKNKFH